MEFHNEDYGALVQSANNNLSEETVDAILAKHPKSKRALVALIKLIHCQQAEDISVDDWECDMSEIVWKEVVAQLKKEKKKGGKKMDIDFSKIRKYKSPEDTEYTMQLCDKLELENCPVGTKVVLYFLNGQEFFGIYQGISDNEMILKSLNSQQIIGLPYNFLNYWLIDISELPNTQEATK